MRLAAHEICSGCTACYAVCPRRAIAMVPDMEGFSYPRIDDSCCVNCGVCARVCPVLNPGEERTPIRVYAAKAKSESLRLASSSGGVFSLIAKAVIRKGGLVFGAAFDNSDWHVYHRAVDNEIDLAELRGSKYLQSYMGNCIQEVRFGLASGRDVLFSGTPCQVAGLRQFLMAVKGLPLEKLVLVEIACQAVPSPYVWETYISWRMKLDCTSRKSLSRGIRRIAFRCKDLGWKRYSMAIEKLNGTSSVFEHDKDAYMRAFMAGLCCRPSCHNCKSRELRSGADLTIADYWGVDQRFPDMDDDKGVSLVLSHTEKGSKIIDAISSDAELRVSDFQHACKINPMIIHSPPRHVKRAYFLHSVNERNFGRIVEKCLRMSMISRLKFRIGTILHSMGLRK